MVERERRPMDVLEDRFVYHRVRNRFPPTVCFGFGLAPETFVDYAKRTGLLTYIDETRIPPCLRKPDNIDWVASCDKVWKHLRRVCDADLHYEVPIHHTCIMMVSLYTNYTMKKERYRDEDEKEILDILREELRPTAGPKWYWSIDNSWDMCVL